MKVVLTNATDKQLQKINKGNPKASSRIKQFLSALENIAQPKLLPNAKKLENYDDSYRWRVGEYRIIGLIKDKELIIQIIKIATREGAYD